MDNKTLPVASPVPKDISPQTPTEEVTPEKHQPWKEILDDIIAKNEADPVDEDFFNPKDGFYSHSLAAWFLKCGHLDGKFGGGNPKCTPLPPPTSVSYLYPPKAEADTGSPRGEGGVAVSYRLYFEARVTRNGF
jgi:hypothetical protein